MSSPDPTETIRESTMARSASGQGRPKTDTLRDRRFGSYRLLELIGRGGMGSVYKAKRVDGELDQVVAIKLAERFWRDPQADERFRRERQILADLIHPNIARLLDGGTSEDGIAYLVMEFIEGTRIDRYCDDRQLDIKSRLRLFLQLCDAVAYAHEHLIVHRDLKPSNVLVTPAGEVKLLDFGVAKALNVPQADETQTIILTPDYASPEQVSGAQVTTASDVYGLGAVLYCLLTGHAPRKTEDSSPVGLLEAHQAPITRPRRYSPALAKDLENILLKALHSDPGRRYRSAGEFAEDIGRFLAKRPVKASPDRVSYRLYRFSQRHGIALSAAVIAFAVIVSATVAYVREAHRAEHRFGQLHTLASRSLFEIERSIRNVPGTLQARRQIARTAGEYLQSLSEDAQGNKALVRELAEAYDDLGDVERSLGQTQSALLDYKKSLAFMQSIGDDRSGSPSQRLQYVKTSGRIASVEATQGNAGSAVKKSKQMVDFTRAWFSESGQISPASQAFLQSLRIHGDNLEQNGDEAGARRVLEEARSIGLLVVQRQPDNDDIAFLAGSSICRLADLCNALKDGRAGYQYGWEARGILEKLVSRHPDIESWRRTRVMSISSIAAAAKLLAKEHPAFRKDAIDRAREAYVAAKSDALRDREDMGQLDNYVVMTQRLAAHLDDANRTPEALTLMEEAQLQIRHLIELNPADARNRYLRADNQINIGDMLVHLNRWEGADRALTQAEMYTEDALKASPNDAVVLEDKIGLISDQVTVALKRNDTARARARCNEGLELAARLIRQDRAMSAYLSGVPDLERRAKQLGIADPILGLKSANQ